MNGTASQDVFLLPQRTWEQSSKISRSSLELVLSDQWVFSGGRTM